MQTSEIFSNTNGFQSSGASGFGSRSSGDFEVALDPATSMIFSSDTQKNVDLKKMLDGNKDGLKLAAMRRIIAMVAQGKDCSDLFPAVVKNVVSKDPEVKKLVYVYLTRYAEEQEDLALLSISTFQRSLKDSNQLIRASALRVLSSNRIAVIVPILLSAIREGVVDLSAYVRKTAARAIPKLYSLDPSQKDFLIEVVAKILEDKSTLVVGSAVQAFEEVCPERLDLIHKHFRKLCSLIMDVDEWGQVAVINMLTRYARTQFPNPVTCVDDPTVRAPKVLPNSMRQAHTASSLPAGASTPSQTWLSADCDENADLDTESSDDDGQEDEDGKTGELDVAAVNMLRADYRMLITACRLLLLSHNTAVVVAVSQLFYHCAPKDEMPAVVRALVRILRSSKEIQHVVLSNIASISHLHPQLFKPHLRMFFVFNNDPTQVKLLKLEILANLISESSSAVILRELQAYVNSSDREFVLAAVQCIGRCASVVPQIAETCLTGLLRLMSRKNESLVAESVVVMRKLLQMQTADHKDLIVHIARLVDEIAIPSARASILWLLGEYGHRVPKTAPDVLRKMAKTFPNEDVAVKLQILNLAAKLCIINPRQTQLLAQYVFTLAKYDQNYDIRDRSRFFRALIFPATTASITQSADSVSACLARNVKKILLATKPAPVLRSSYADRPAFQLGSMSQLLGRRLSGYRDLPDWPLVPPDPTTRRVGMPPPCTAPASDRSVSISQQDTESDSSSEGEGEGSTDDLGMNEEADQSEEDAVDEEYNSDSLQTESESDDERAPPIGRRSKLDSDSSTEEDDAEEKQLPVPPRTKTITTAKIPKKKKPNKSRSQEAASSVDLLLDLGVAPVSTPQDSLLASVLVPTSFELKTPSSTEPTSAKSRPASFIPPGEEIVEMNILSYEVPPADWFPVTPAYCEPLAIEARFTRTLCNAFKGSAQVNVELRFTNKSFQKNALRAIRASPATAMHSFAEISSLEFGAQTTAFVGLAFNDSTLPVRLEVQFHVGAAEESTTTTTTTGNGVVDGRQRFEEGRVTAEIGAPVGELFSPAVDMNQQTFMARRAQLRGMHETTRALSRGFHNEPRALAKAILRRANLSLVGLTTRLSELAEQKTYILRFAGATVKNKEDCLVEVTIPENVETTVGGSLSVRTEAISLGLQLASDIAECLA